MHRRRASTSRRRVGFGLLVGTDQASKRDAGPAGGRNRRRTERADLAWPFAASVRTGPVTGAQAPVATRAGSVRCAAMLVRPSPVDRHPGPGRARRQLVWSPCVRPPDDETGSKGQPGDAASGSLRRTAPNNVMRGRPAERQGRRRERSKPLKGEPQGCHRRETKPGRSREEQSVRRLRKPGGAAQPDAASPVLVASRFLKRRRGEKPHEGMPRLRMRRSTAGQTLERSASPREDDMVCRAPCRQAGREYLKGPFARPRP